MSGKLQGKRLAIANRAEGFYRVLPGTGSESACRRVSSEMALVLFYTHAGNKERRAGTNDVE